MSLGTTLEVLSHFCFWFLETLSSDKHIYILRTVPLISSIATGTPYTDFPSCLDGLIYYVKGRKKRWSAPVYCSKTGYPTLVFITSVEGPGSGIYLFSHGREREGKKGRPRPHWENQGFHLRYTTPVTRCSILLGPRVGLLSFGGFIESWGISTWWFTLYFIWQERTRNMS